VVTFADGGRQEYSESFVADNSAPSLEVSSVSTTGNASAQSLVVVFEALDDIDISTLSVNLLGLRASDLRASAGVVERAEESAFARTIVPQMC